MASQETLALATRVIRSLTGGRWTWPPVRVTDRYPLSDNGRVRLDGVPVREVFSVTAVGSPDTQLPWVKSGSAFLVLRENDYPGLLGSSRCYGPTQIEVDYEYGSRPPIGLQNAIDELADQLGLAHTNPDACKLPERVTSVTRQGISWTVLDPQDFLDQGRTGIYEVDLLLQAENRGKAKARSRVFSTEYPPPDRRSVTVLPIP